MTKVPLLQPSTIEPEVVTIRPIHAYTSVSMCANLTILLLHFPTVAPFAPVIGLGAGLGFAYLFSKG